MRAHFVFKSAMLLLSLAGLSACGGSGSGSNNNQAVNRAPIVDAGAPQSVHEFANVTLSGTASDADGDTLAYRWEQVSGLGVTINSSTAATANFDAPDVLATSTPETLTFRLTVNDGTTSREDTVEITVIDIGLGTNSAPTAAAGFDRSVVELTPVDLDGSASSDPDGDALGYSWVQIDGPIVTLNGADSATPSFTAPDVAPGASVALTFELTVDDGTDTATDTVVVSVSEAMSMVTVAGRLTYERPLPNQGCRGYDFSFIVDRPVRLATVFLLDAAGNVLGTTQTDEDGNYSFPGITANTDARVRVRAQLVQTSGPQTWEVYVRDNTSNIGLSLPERPIYEVQWGLFNTGSVNSNDNDFTARTGWDSVAGAYDDQQRLAAPLAILDSLLDGVLLVTSVDPDVDLGRIDAFWSINNSWVELDDPDVDNGELVTAYYSSNPDRDFTRNPSLFLRGDAIGRFPESIIDTDEFDEYVILHEWGHFFEDELARSDSIGGSHWIPGTVEARVAFGEGWGNAIGAIAPGKPVGCDTGQPASSGSSLNMETYNSYSDEQGFFNEMSVATFLYDLWDAANDGADTGSIGFAPIYETMTGFQRDTEAFTTLFSFATGLRQNVDPGSLPLVDVLLAQENVDTAVLDIWASGQTTQPAIWHNGSTVLDLLPLYTELTPGGATENLCVNNGQVIDQHGNKPGEWRYLRFTLASPQSLTLTLQANPVPPPTNDPTTGVRDRADPDVFLYRNGQWLGDSRSPDDDREVFNMGALAAGTYTMAFQDWRYEDTEIASDYPDRVCFDITLN